MTKDEFLKRVDELYAEYTSNGGGQCEYEFLSYALADLLIEYKGGDA